MKRRHFPWLVPGVVAGSFVPLVVLSELAWSRQLGANPIEVILNQLGFVAMVLLLSSLACTPLKRITGWKWLIRLRKPLGVMGFVYALLHFLTYIGLDRFFNFGTLWQDISKRPFVILGFTALMMLFPLAATSTADASRRLGKNWKRIHRIAYVIPILVIIHFTMRMKADIQQPLIYGAVLAVLLGTRVAVAAINRRNAPAWDGYRQFKVVKKEPEPGRVCSFYLEPLDGKKLPPYKPGQYLTFKVDLGGSDDSVIRCYSMSQRPNPDWYRISIKRIPSGTASIFFHDRIMEGTVVDVKAPKGRFFVKSAARPLVLIGGGIGVTPLLAMLDAFTASDARGDIFFCFGVRNSTEHCFRDQLTAIASRNRGVKFHICYSSPLPEDRAGIDYNSTGHITAELLAEVLPGLDCDFYVCGPPPMMAQLKADLADSGVPAERFHIESFGSTPVKRPAGADSVNERFVVSFELSGKTLVWDTKYGSLLEFAEANGIEIEFGCRTGNCGSCEVEVNSGEVEYLLDPGAVTEEGVCLTCVTVPKMSLSIEA